MGSTPRLIVMDALPQVNFVAADDNGGNGYFLFVQVCSVGGTKVFQPPLSMMICQAGVPNRDGIIQQRNIAMGISSEQDFWLCEIASVMALVPQFACSG